METTNISPLSDLTVPFMKLSFFERSVYKCGLYCVAASGTLSPLLFYSYVNMKYSCVITPHEAQSLVNWQQK